MHDQFKRVQANQEIYEFKKNRNTLGQAKKSHSQADDVNYGSRVERDPDPFGRLHEKNYSPAPNLRWDRNMNRFASEKKKRPPGEYH
jgi:hypothetical protein